MALSTLSTVVQVDVESVNKHKSTVLDCLKDSDISIRKRALDVAYSLVNSTNVEVSSSLVSSVVLIFFTRFECSFDLLHSFRV